MEPIGFYTVKEERRASMKLENALRMLGEIKEIAENEDFDKGLISMSILCILLDYIGNDKIKEAVDDIPF
jgi:hypothetical protein